MELAVQAEITKLAMELEVDEAELAPFARLDADQLRQLRTTIARRLDERFRPVFQSIERASRLIPAALTVKIAMRFFPPMVLGRTSTELAPDKAQKLLPMIPVEFLADCVPYLDPERSKPLVAALPWELVRPTTVEVLRRGDHVTLGRMLGGLPVELIDDVVPLVTDGRDLLLIGFHTEDTTVLDPIVAAMSEEQLAALCAAADDGLHAEAAYVAVHLEQAQLDRLSAHASPELLAALQDG